MNIDLTQIDELWKRQEGQRAAMAKRRRYYHGDTDIRRRNERYSSGVKKSNVPTNWSGYIVDMYVGAMTEQPYQLVQDNEDLPDTTDVYAELAKLADLDAVDAETLRNALICGYGLELHEFDGEAPRVIPEKPERWALLRDENDAILVAVTRMVIEKGGVFRGELVQTDTEIQYVYDAASRKAYRRPYSTTGRGDWEELETTQHYYGRVPIVETRVNDERRSILSDALLDQIDEYEEIDSLSGDDIRNTADAMLVLKGADPAWVTANSELINVQRVLPLPNDCSAEYLIRVTDTARINDRLTRCREAIHIMGNVPDTQQIVGATGGTSGIALQLKFMPMQQRAGAFIKFIAQSVRERVDVFNSMLGKSRELRIENYRVLVSFSMPVNRIEEWQNIGALEGIVSHRTQLQLLSDIDNADQELKNLERDMARDAEVRALTEGPEVQAARQDVQVQQALPQVDGTIQNALDLIGDRLLAAVTRTR